MKKLLVFPFNGNGLEALDCIKGQYELIGFIDDTKEKQGLSPYGFEVFSRNALEKYPEAEVLAVPGSYQNFLQRIDLINSLNIATQRFATVIHPKTSISDFSKIGHNVLIMAGNVLTSNCTIGNHVLMLPSSIVHHDSIIEDYTIIGSKTLIAGNVSIGKNCYIASGSNIINGITVGEKSLIGLGSNVLKSVNKNSRIAGNPAKPI